MQKNATYGQWPPQFMQGVFLAPHNFSDPENILHGQMVNFQLKSDLYDESFMKIQALEFGVLDDTDAFLKLEDIKECDNKEGLVQKFIDSRKVNKEDDELLRCEQWTINNSNTHRRTYKLKYFQSKTDRFFSLLYPATFLQSCSMFIRGEM